MEMSGSETAVFDEAATVRTSKCGLSTWHSNWTASNGNPRLEREIDYDEP
jgi:hypothetical protein